MSRLPKTVIAMSDERNDKNIRHHPPRPITEWESQYAAGDWNFLGSLNEGPRFFLIAGYIHRLIKSGAVLDAGCGEGHLANCLDHSRVRYHGFDPSATAIDNARKLYPGASFQVSSAEDFSDNFTERFDAVVFNEVLTQLSDPIGQLNIYSKALKTAGVFVISTFQGHNKNSNGKVVTEMLDREISDGRFTLLAGAEVTSLENDLRWRVFVLR